MQCHLVMAKYFLQLPLIIIILFNAPRQWLITVPLVVPYGDNILFNAPWWNMIQYVSRQLVTCLNYNMH